MLVPLLTVQVDWLSRGESTIDSNLLLTTPNRSNKKILNKITQKPIQQSHKARESDKMFISWCRFR